MDIQLINGDLIQSIYGDLAVISDNDDILQTAINNINTKYGELELHNTYGNTAFAKRMKLSDINLSEVENACESAILQDERVSRITSISASKSTTVYGQCTMSFTLLTNDGTILSSSTALTVI